MNALPGGSQPQWAENLKNITKPITKREQDAQNKFSKQKDTDLKGLRPQQPTPPIVNQPPRPTQPLPQQPVAHQDPAQHQQQQHVASAPPKIQPQLDPNPYLTFLNEAKNAIKSMNLKLPESTDDKIILNLKDIIESTNEKELPKKCHETVDLLLQYLNNNKNRPEFKNCISSLQELKSLSPAERRRTLNLIIAVYIHSQPKATRPSPAPQASAPPASRLPQQQAAAARPAQQPQNIQNVSVQPHSELRKPCGRVQNSCFINTTLHVCAHMNVLYNLFDPAKNRLNPGDPRKAFQDQGRKLFDQIRRSESVPANELKTFFTMLYNLNAFQAEKSLENLLKDGFDSRVLIAGIQSILDPNNTKEKMKEMTLDELGPPKIPANVPLQFQQQVLQQMQMKKERKAVDVSTASSIMVKATGVVETNKPKTSYPDTIVLNNETYKLEIVLYGGGGHNVPYIQMGDGRFAKYDDISGVEIVNKAYLENIDNVTGCLYVKV